MAIPSVEKQDVINALKYIDENGVPPQHQRTGYDLETKGGKTYPPKYVLAVADHLANGTAISTEGFNAVEAKSYLEGLGIGFTIRTKKFVLTISAENIESSDERFTMDDLTLGDNYKPLNVYFKKATGDLSSALIARGKKEIPIKPCRDLPSSFSKRE